MSAPGRSLAGVLRRQAAAPSVGVLVGRVVSVPNSRQLVVEIAGANVTVPRLASYASPVAGDAVYMLTADAFTIALGTCK